MNQGSEFSRLEDYVRKLLAQYEDMVVENNTLQKRIEHLEEEIGDLQVAVRTADSERGDISSRIKGLIEKIEEWETSLVRTENGVEKHEGEQVDIDHETRAGESAEENEEEKEKNLQQNLFHVQPRANN